MAVNIVGNVRRSARCGPAPRASGARGPARSFRPRRRGVSRFTLRERNEVRIVVRRRRRCFSSERRRVATTARRLVRLLRRKATLKLARPPTRGSAPSREGRPVAPHRVELVVDRLLATTNTRAQRSACSHRVPRGGTPETKVGQQKKVPRRFRQCEAKCCRCRR